MSFLRGIKVPNINNSLLNTNTIMLAYDNNTLTQAPILPNPFSLNADPKLCMGLFNLASLSQIGSINQNSSLNNLSFGKDYAEEFRQNVTGSASKFKYTASSQQIKQNAGQYFHKKGTYTPKRGDIAIWTKINDPAHGHVGIVTKVEGDTIWITEGNSGNAVKTNKYSLSKLMRNSGSRPLNGFIDTRNWLGPNVALKAAQIAEIEESKGVVESSTRGGGSNDSPDIRKYKRGAINHDQWCAYFTSYCFTDGQNMNAIA